MSDSDPNDNAVPLRYYGKYAGIVLHNDPPADGSAHRGELTVQVPGILEETPDGLSQQAIQVVAAPAFLPGFFFVPEVQAPVWVEFVAGDINFPIWTGVWYPDGMAPLTTDPAASGQPSTAPTLDQKVIRTKSGLVLQLDDTSGGEKLIIGDEKHQNVLTLDENGVNIDTEGSGRKVTLKVGGSVKVEVSSDTITISVSETRKIELKSDSICVSSVSGDAAGVVLAPLLDWLENHQHVGNMGAPTPLFPADRALFNLKKLTFVSSKA